MAAFADHFSAIASGYAQFRPTYPASLFSALASVVPDRLAVWDCACGSGQASIPLAAHFDGVYATDASLSQLAEAPAYARVRYHVASAEQSALRTGSVALVTVAQALHWFDVPAFHREATRVLKPGGIVAEWSYALMSVPSNPRLTALVNDLDRDMRTWWPPQRRHVDTHYRDLEFPFAAVDMGAFDMRATWTRDQLLGYLATWSAITRHRAQTGVNPLEPIWPALLEAWGSTETLEIRWPLTLRVGQVGSSSSRSQY